MAFPYYSDDMADIGGYQEGSERENSSISIDFQQKNELSMFGKSPSWVRKSRDQLSDKKVTSDVAEVKEEDNEDEDISRTHRH